LAELVEKHKITYDFFNKDKVISDSSNTVDVGRFLPIPLLFQTGYLTVERWENNGENSDLHLTVPNHEVRTSLFTHLAALNFSVEDPNDLRRKGEKILQALKMKDASGMEKSFKAFLSSIPYKIHIPYEGYYQTIFLLIINLLGQPIIVEEQSAMGVVDAVIDVVNGDIFIIEMKYIKQNVKNINIDKKNILLKGVKNSEKATKNSDEQDDIPKLLDQAVRKAFAQLEDKEYAVKYAGQGRNIVKTALAVHHRTDVRVVFEECR
jgi:hypothetical protein